MQKLGTNKIQAVKYFRLKTKFLKKWNDVMFSCREMSKTMRLYDMKDLQAQASNW